MKTSMLSTWAIAGTLGVSLATTTARITLEAVQAAAGVGLEALDAFEAEFSARIRGAR